MTRGHPFGLLYQSHHGNLVGLGLLGRESLALLCHILGIGLDNHLLQGLSALGFILANRYRPDIEYLASFRDIELHYYPALNACGLGHRRILDIPGEPLHQSRLPSLELGITSRILNNVDLQGVQLCLGLNKDNGLAGIAQGLGILIILDHGERSDVLRSKGLEVLGIQLTAVLEIYGVRIVMK